MELVNKQTVSSLEKKPINNPINSNYKKVQIILQRIIIILSIIFIFLLSLFFSRLEIPGDQDHYLKAYNAVKGIGYLNALKVYRGIIFTFEIMHFSIIWVASNLGIDKHLFMSLANTYLFYMFYKFLRSKGFSFTYAILISICNYYLYAVFFILEKLKFAILFLLILLNYSKSIKSKTILILVSILTHLQLFLIYFSNYIASKIKINFIYKVKKKNLKNIIIFSIILCITCLFLIRISSLLLVFDKVLFYFLRSKDQGLSVLTNSLIITLLTLFSTNKPKQAFFYNIFLMVFILLFGSDRLNMFIYFGFLYFLAPKKWQSKVFIIITSSFFLIKSILFLSEVYNYSI